MMRPLYMMCVCMCVMEKAGDCCLRVEGMRMRGKVYGEGGKGGQKCTRQE
jgi:hypothetical protein